jgi:hypothetical protein
VRPRQPGEAPRGHSKPNYFNAVHRGERISVRQGAYCAKGISMTYSGHIFKHFHIHNKRHAKHSAAPREHIHSRTPLVIPDNPTKHHEQPQTGTLRQPIFIRGHTHARPEPDHTGLRKHPQTRSVHEEVPPTQPSANLPQRACNKGRSRDPARAGRFTLQYSYINSGTLCQLRMVSMPLKVRIHGGCEI